MFDPHCRCPGCGVCDAAIDLPRLTKQVKKLKEQKKKLTAAPTLEKAYEMGANGGEALEEERLAFEAWMKGHCWALSAEWDGTGYRSELEQGGEVDPLAMQTRRIWAAWRDRAALTRGMTQ